MAFTEVNISKFSLFPSQYFPWTHSAAVSLGVKYKATETYWTYLLTSKIEEKELNSNYIVVESEIIKR